jgi:hypothetical protein
MMNEYQCEPVERIVLSSVISPSRQPMKIIGDEHLRLQNIPNSSVPADTSIGEFVSTTDKPRDSPSVSDIASMPHRLSPSNCRTSSTTVLPFY